MSCQLSFVPTGDECSVEKFRDFLRDRRWYDVERDRALYTDGDTGVSFQLQWTDEDGEMDRVDFEMDYLRPSFFGLEAAGELEALVAEFDLAPRTTEDAGEVGTFTAEKFVDGWNRGNRAAIESATDAERPVHRLDAERLRDAWRWNRSRQEYQTVLGEGIFVPSIRFLAEGDAILRASVWPETIPFALPDAADVILVSGLEHEGLTSESSELRVVEADELGDLVAEHADKIDRRSDPTDHLLVGWARPPRGLLEALPDAGVPAEDREFDPVSADDILDA